MMKMAIPRMTSVPADLNMDSMTEAAHHTLEAGNHIGRNGLMETLKLLLVDV